MSSPAFLPSSPLLSLRHRALSRTSPPRPSPRTPARAPLRRAPTMDTNPVLVAATTLLGTAGGIGLLVFTENQGKRTEERENTQPCTECAGVKETVCEVCSGEGLNVIKQEESCSYCDGKGKIKCMNCAGTGVQPRFLDRLSPDDFLD